MEMGREFKEISELPEAWQLWKPDPGRKALSKNLSQNLSNFNGRTPARQFNVVHTHVIRDDISVQMIGDLGSAITLEQLWSGEISVKNQFGLILALLGWHCAVCSFHVSRLKGFTPQCCFSSRVKKWLSLAECGVSWWTSLKQMEQMEQAWR